MPWGGSCDISPKEGTAYQTLFTINCSGFEDSTEDSPLFYRFFVRSSEHLDGPPIPLDSHYLSVATFPTYLPTLPGDGSLIIYAEISDRWGTTAHIDKFQNISDSLADSYSDRFITVGLVNISPSAGLEERGPISTRNHIETANQTLYSGALDQHLRTGRTQHISTLIISILSSLNAASSGAGNANHLPQRIDFDF